MWYVHYKLSEKKIYNERDFIDIMNIPDIITPVMNSVKYPLMSPFADTKFVLNNVLDNLYNT